MPTVPFLGSYGDISGSGLMFRNKIINGDMSIFQRQVAASTNSSFALDRWYYIKANDATESMTQSTDAPIGFSYSLRSTVSVGDPTIGANQYTGVVQAIEGFNIRDLGFGTAFAKSVTLQFWIKSSVAGVYNANIANSDSSRICPFNFTINASNTWEYKSVTLPGCTDGTWNTTNGVGILLRFYAAMGSDYLGGTNGVWNSTLKYGSATPVNGIASNGNIFAITGVQLESGPLPSSFEYLPFDVQLARCQRYYEKSYNYDVVPTTNTNLGSLYHLGSSDAGGATGMNIFFKVMKRATPSGFAAITRTGSDGWDYGRSGASGTIATASLTLTYLGASGGLVFGNVGANWAVCWVAGHYVASAEF